MDLRAYQNDAIIAFNKSLAIYNRDDGILFLQIPTGGGKTAIAVELAKQYLEKNAQNKVLWLAPEWNLIGQARKSLFDAVGSEERFRRIGVNESVSQVRDLKTNTKGNIFLSSIHTWNRNQDDLLDYRDNLIVIVDEAHWGINKKMMKSLYDFCHGSKAAGIPKAHVPLIGLTATPKVPFFVNYQTVYSISFSELVKQGYLAKPNIINIPTNVVWTPKFTKDGNFEKKSLEQLNSKERNNVVVKVVTETLAYDGRRGILFATSVAHANALFKELSERNICCSIVHGDNNNEKDNNKMISDFRCGITNLMIAVNMLRQGFDVPEITDVFLVTPSNSEVAISQMIGRGSRIIRGQKREFYVYDFHDIINESTAEKIFIGNDYYNNENTVDDEVSKQSEKIKHVFPDSPQVIKLDNSFNILEGLQFIDNQTFEFSVEIGSREGIVKFDTNKWDQGADALLSELQDVLGNDAVYDEGISCVESDGYDFSSQWRVEESRAAGWRICSPLLQGREHLMLVIEVLEALQVLVSESTQFVLNHRCSFILKLSTRLNTTKKQINALQTIARIEPGLFPLVTPARRYFYNNESEEFDRKAANRYCVPLTDDKNFNAVAALIKDDDDSKIKICNRTSVSFSNVIESPHLLQIRLHHGCLDSIKLVTWLSLWMTLINYISRDQATAESEDIATIVSDDLFELLNQEGIQITEKLKSLLWQQRKALSRHWKMVVSKKYDRWKNSNWFSLTK
jgi:superfamily II DNA or RNA helicase